jgi:hypothetical protein
MVSIARLQRLRGAKSKRAVYAPVLSELSREESDGSDRPDRRRSFPVIRAAKSVMK